MSPPSYLPHTNTLLTLTPEFDTLFHTHLFAKYMKPFIIPRLEHGTSRQVCFEAIGGMMTREHFCDYPDTPNLLSPPYITAEVKQQLVTEFREEVIKHVVERAREEGLRESEGVRGFEKRLGEAYESQLETFRAVKERKRRREEEKYRRGRASSTLGNTQTLQELEEVVRYSTECSVLEEVGVGLASILDSRETLSRFNSRVLNFVALGKDTSSDLYVLPENIPRRVYDRVTGRLFPRALRLHLYDKHLKSEKNGSGNRSKGSEEVDYSTLVMNAAADKGITDPRRTNVNNLLSHTVNVAFSETGEDFKESGQWMKDRALAVLNMYYTLTGKNSVQMSYVLVPFLSLHDRGEVGDDTFEFKILHYLDTFIARVTSKPSVEVAAAAAALLSTLDPKLFKHLGDTFVSHEGGVGNKAVMGARKVEGLFREIIDLCFVGLLGKKQLEFVWDHCFLYGWRGSVAALFCVDLVILQRHNLMYFGGGIGECLKVMRGNRTDILSSELMDRMAYYLEKDLVGDMILDVWREEDEVRGGYGVRGRLEMLFKFKDDDYSLSENERAATSPRLDELEGRYNEEVVGCIRSLMESVVKVVAAVKVQALLRGKNTRRMVADKGSAFWEKRRAAGMGKESPAGKVAGGGVAGAGMGLLVIQKFLRSAVARRRVKKAKESRLKKLEMEGKADDTEEVVIEVEFDVGRLAEGGLGFKCRAAFEENVALAIERGLVESQEEGMELAEVNTVGEGGYAEEMCVAPGDLLLEIAGKTVKFKKLRKSVEKAKSNGLNNGIVKMKFMRGVRVKAGVAGKVDKGDLPVGWKGEKGGVVDVDKRKT